ncbi:MAG: DUF460 domain-containing protein [Candidatus Nanohaloarchaeota archaeon QJJ-9]|nr:DUF460 domain-containing protein [Candidatus Nanohaloarchaeota archaeon QJJ-9]
MVRIRSIVGIDPGTTTAVAVINLEGELLGYKSRKEFSESKINEYIISFGKPLIVATDVSKVPSLVEKIASTFSAELYAPKKDLGQEEKEAIVKETHEDELDSHSKDAISAAIKAFKENRQTLEKLIDQVKQRKIEKEDLALEKAFRGKKSLAQMEKEKAEKEREEESRVQKPSIDWESRARDLKEELKRKKKEVERLRNYIEDLKKEKETIEEEKDQMELKRKKEAFKDSEVDKWRKKAKSRFKRIKKEEEKVEKLEKKLEKYRKGLKRAYNSEKLLKVLKTEEEVKNYEKELAFIEEGVQAEPSKETKIAIVEDTEDKEFYMEKGLKAVEKQNTGLLELEDYVVVDLGSLEPETKTAENFMDWLEAYRAK